MSLNFTALDFETANHSRASVCRVGLTKVRDGRAVDAHGWTIRPPVAHNWFDAFNTRLHGIGPGDVVAAPGWGESLAQITEYIGEDVVVAHNAAFDLSVLREACIAEGLPWPSIDFLCTLLSARRVFDLHSYRLPFIMRACGVELLAHHDATADAWAAATVMTAMVARTGSGSLEEFAATHRLRIGHIESGLYVAARWNPPNNGLVAPDGNPDADPDGPLFEKVVVFTGTLASMRRQEAWEQVAAAGGVPEKNVTKRTHVLVAGDLNPATFSPDATTTARVTKAFALKDAGQPIEVMTEHDFLQAITPGGGGDSSDLDLLLSGDDPTPDSSPFYAGLNHPEGRATGGEPCVVCDEPIASGAAWVWRDRHVCGSACNVTVKRWYKRWIAVGRPPGGWVRRRR
ncbi:exonuclease domain-containing protein [Luteipulveratus halotolerans]|uniref:exonuclease domain-containing protein n=1 Tax=Luteipulveratus halotolerans TaxID=1631356 RepID=UPI00068180F9|nr:exonuclease domain-containing protein [Luteipulveratus halotolerans]